MAVSLAELAISFVRIGKSSYRKNFWTADNVHSIVLTGQHLSKVMDNERIASQRTHMKSVAVVGLHSA